MEFQKKLMEFRAKSVETETRKRPYEVAFLIYA